MADLIEQAWGIKSAHSIFQYFNSMTGRGHLYRYEKKGIGHVSKLEIYRAPDPNDIIWSNLSASMSQKIKRRLITFSMTFLLLCISFGAILSLKLAQYVMYSDNKIGETGLRFISITITIVIAVINLLLNYLITVLTMAEKHDTESSYFRSLMTKIVIAGLVNTNLLVIIAHVIVYKPREAIFARGNSHSNQARCSQTPSSSYCIRLLYHLCSSSTTTLSCGNYCAVGGSNAR